MRGGFKIFDTHTHVGEAKHSGRRTTVDALLQSMDRHGIDRSLAIPFPVVEDYRQTHDLIGDALKRHPSRLSGAACLDPNVGEQAYRDEVRRCREVHGFTALKVQPQYTAINPLWKRHHYVFECAVENRLTLVWHTGSGIPY